MNYKLIKKNDFFPVHVSIKNLYKLSYELSDLSLFLSYSFNKFERVVISSFYDVDAFISTFNVNRVAEDLNRREDYFVTVNDKYAVFLF